MICDLESKDANDNANGWAGSVDHNAENPCFVEHWEVVNKDSKFESQPHMDAVKHLPFPLLRFLAVFVLVGLPIFTFVVAFSQMGWGK